MKLLERKIKTVGTIPEFLNPIVIEKDTSFNKMMNHIEDNQLIYKAAGFTLLILLNGFGAESVYAIGDGHTGGLIDKEAKVIYGDLVDIGKWLIIGKGGWEVIVSVLKSDGETAKKKFIGYLIAYVCLLGLPTAFDKVDSIFERIGG